MKHLAELPVLDAGHVRLEQVMGGDLDVANAAYASTMRQVTEFSDRQKRLIYYLARNEEGHPFRHCVARFLCKAPLFVARQLHTYTVAACHREDQYAWSEASRRYITDALEFYRPAEWRAAPESMKQGSGGPLEQAASDWLWARLERAQRIGVSDYEDALKSGCCAEQARLLLPAYGLYVHWQMTLSLSACLHFLKERIDHKAQWETQQYATAVGNLLMPWFEESIRAWGLAEGLEAQP